MQFMLITVLTSLKTRINTDCLSLTPVCLYEGLPSQVVCSLSGDQGAPTNQIRVFPCSTAVLAVEQGKTQFVIFKNKNITVVYFEVLTLKSEDSYKIKRWFSWNFFIFIYSLYPNVCFQSIFWRENSLNFDKWFASFTMKSSFKKVFKHDI